MPPVFNCSEFMEERIEEGEIYECDTCGERIGHCAVIMNGGAYCSIAHAIGCMSHTDFLELKYLIQDKEKKDGHRRTPTERKSDVR